MASEQITDREAALLARIKELEGAQAESATTVAEGGVFESVWRGITDAVPPWLAAAAMAVLVAHYGFGYYLQSQVTAAETQLKEAKAKLEIAKSNSVNAPDAQGVTLRLAQLKAEIDNKRADAAAAKAKATALNAEINGESAALAGAKANLNNLQQQARLAQAKADALSKETGYGTLAQQEAYLKLWITELKAANARWSGGLISNGPSIRALCVDNQFAEELKCPAVYVEENRRNKAKEDGTTPPEPAKPAQVASAPGDDNGNFWKVPNSQNCAPAWQYFRNEARHGAFAVGKYVKKNACGWSWSPSRPIDEMRREAMEWCAKSAVDCKIVAEK